MNWNAVKIDLIVWFIGHKQLDFADHNYLICHKIYFDCNAVILMLTFGLAKRGLTSWPLG